MNIKEFYHQQKQREEDNFTQNTGLNIRHAFQKYNSGNGNDEFFSLKLSSQRECFGIEFSGCVFYLLPKSEEISVLLIYDDTYMPILETMSDWSEARYNVYGRYVHSLTSAIENGCRGDLSNNCIFLDEDMLCFTKQIYFPLIEKIKEGSLMDPDLITEAVSLVQFRNQCGDEIVSFAGFSSRDEKEIALKEGLSAFKRGLKIVRFLDYYTDN